MSSRLFQEIRERRGLAYSVYSYTSQYADTGLFGVYAGCAPGKVDEVLALTREELARVADHGITDEEIARGKGMLKGSLVLGLEDTGSRMSRLGKGELLYDELLTVDQILATVDAVTPDEVREIAAVVLGGSRPWPSSALRRPRLLGLLAAALTSPSTGALGWRCERARADPGRVCWAPVGAWAPRSAGRSTPPRTSNWWRWSTRATGCSTSPTPRPRWWSTSPRPTTVMDHVHWCIDQGINVVVGTSGFTEPGTSGSGSGCRTSPTWA
jgi:hypothetical protein